MGQIFETLQQLGLTSAASRVQIAQGTRDVADLPVYQDRVSGVVFIDDFYTGDGTYKTGAYRADQKPTVGAMDYELHRDANRRFADYQQFIIGRSIVDFGCGRGDLLRLAKPVASAVAGIELQEDYILSLGADGIRAERSMSAIKANCTDTVFVLHTLEHLPDPLQILAELKTLLKKGGMLVVEVPHARDFLLTHLECESFRRFTLWSQHLILHTRESLIRLLSAAGFVDIVVQGKQRYPLSNHLTWLGQQAPGGHKGLLSALDTPALTAAYEASLQQIDATDTLVAIATA